jgi:hypothetical protein
MIFVNTIAGIIISQLEEIAYRRDAITVKRDPKMNSFRRLYLSWRKPIGIARRVLPIDEMLLTAPNSMGEAPSSRT